ncbi:hypothetical protein M413DRAFT_20657 [Hebeloma cylindrosporum]|uniref:CxC2-like cysteine cluster KDZ transposase-associated domain-containing protein n=1 Tax=Hebeloma cylindrosporum TaxID=76867 RepID=A0A0C2Y4L3_HEBCY|nr:hypothetical protein M413DRAFT_20657 [Hebeloma cylindrosporum h7]
MARHSFKTHIQALNDIKQGASSGLLERDDTRYVQGTTMAGSSSSTFLSALPPPPQPLFIQQPSTTPMPVPVPAPAPLSIKDDPPVSKKTQVRMSLNFNLTVPLNVDRRTTRCCDCFGYELTCIACFIASHSNLPTHWAEVWDSEQGFFVRHDIATLQDNIASVNLGHCGRPCPSQHAANLKFTIIDINGIHQTKIRFCSCEGFPIRTEQLMRAKLFPATMTQPTTAFTFPVLKQFHLLHLEGKLSAYDFIGALRRLSDSAFPQRIADPSPQFRLIMRIWRFLTATKHQGQAHGIDLLLPHRRQGNLIVYCPSCLELYVNMEPGTATEYSFKRHLIQTQHTADGNHHSNKYAKNTDPDDVSLYEGRAYFPNDVEYREYIKNLPKNAPEKAPCDHHNVHTKQNRKKIKNMDITGVVNIQCSHVFIKSTADLQLGEKHGNVDYALDHAILNTKPRFVSELYLAFVRICDHVFSYDNTCSLCVNAVSRFNKHFPGEAEFVENIRWLIPLLHVQNHKDNCTYLYSSAYVRGAGHFHGETTEMPWVELNQLAPQTRQMNNGHRQDTIIDHHSHWNWMKTSNMASTLFREIILSKNLFLEKHTIFKKLSAIYAENVPEWNKLDRHSRIVRNKEVQCVYRQYSKKVPSRSRIYQALLAEVETETSTDLTPTIPSFLNEAILISEEQRKVKSRVKALKKTLSQDLSSVALSNEVEKRCERLRAQIQNWCDCQKDLTPQIGDFVARQAIQRKTANAPEEEVLYVPSDFTEAECIKYDLVKLGEHERHFLEGTAFDYISKVKTITKTLFATHADKKAQAYSQQTHTRSISEIEDIEERQTMAILDYTVTRTAMISLGMSQHDPSFPPLSRDDTYRKPTHLKRAIGDSRRNDAEAEMERWREEWEIKQADFLHCIRSFNKMSSVWEEMARNSVEAGKPLFKEMERHTRTLFNDAGYGHLIENLLDNNKGKILADYIVLECSDPRYIIPELMVRVSMIFPQC